MLCYKDKTFCAESDLCANTECPRIFTDEDMKDAIRWWGGEDFLLAVSSYKDTDYCIGFVEKDVREINITPFQSGDENEG